MADTPLRLQYLDVKKRYPDVLLLFRLGDFYETFDDDAHIASRVLGITLTGRDMGKDVRVPMAGIPYHALDNYIGKLLAAGHKVAICEQTTDPDHSPGLVQREVVRVVTPGTVVETHLLDQKANNYLVAIAVQGENAGIASIDITTSEFAVTHLPIDGVSLELDRLHPSEIVFSKDTALLDSWKIAPTTALDPHAFDSESARDLLLRHFGVATLEGYGCEHFPAAIASAAAVLSYVRGTQPAALTQVTGLSTYACDAYMTLDPQTRRNLELFQGSRWGGADHSLLKVLDVTRTPMGGRLLRRWLSQALLDRARLVERHDAVAWLLKHSLSRSKASAVIARIADLERLCNRIRGGIATPRELVALRHSLEAVPLLRETLRNAQEAASPEDPLAALVSQLQPCQEVVDLLALALEDDQPALISDGGVIRRGFNNELDTLRDAGASAKAYLANLEKQERDRTSIKSLKVGYNRVFGYYIEIGRANQSRVPDNYIRKQTLVGGERYITPELKEYESLILNAQGRIQELEISLFRQVCRAVADSAAQILSTAASIAQVDTLAAFAEVASRHGYIRPVISETDELVITNGRHPIVDHGMPAGTFVPNDTQLHGKGNPTGRPDDGESSGPQGSIMVLTGPNMAGKSTYLRQVGLIVLMAQIGSFVPADSARISIVDRIFTRVGLQDDLAAGQSTFMVEMVETAQILNNATAHSLIILDEIGRGTSTYDGLSIARAVVEYIHNHPRLGAKTLFATHYQELTELARYLPRVMNYSVAVSEEGGSVVFLHKIVPGGADKSYGVHVAQLAGVPKAVIARATEVLSTLESGHGHVHPPPLPPSSPAPQLALFTPGSEALDHLRELDISSLTPLEAITKLFELQNRARRDSRP